MRTSNVHNTDDIHATETGRSDVLHADGARVPAGALARDGRQARQEAGARDAAVVGA